MPNAIGMPDQGNVRVHIDDVTVAPCPYCGGEGHIPDGLYDGTAEGIRVIATSAKSAASLTKLARLLEQARDEGASREAVAETIESEAPEFAGLAALIRRLGGVPIATWITLALAILALLQGMSTEERLRNIEGKVDRVLQQVATPATSSTPSPFAPSVASVTKVGRNDPCPCGSGKKYKRCHGR